MSAHGLERSWTNFFQVLDALRACRALGRRIRRFVFPLPVALAGALLSWLRVGLDQIRPGVSADEDQNLALTEGRVGEGGAHGASGLGVGEELTRPVPRALAPTTTVVVHACTVPPRAGGEEEPGGSPAGQASGAAGLDPGRDGRGN